MRHTRYFAFLLLAAAAIAAQGQSVAEQRHQELNKSHRVILFGEGEADSAEYINLLDQFYADQFRQAQDPRAPYFMLMSRDANMAMGVGGLIKARAMYDWHGTNIDGADFVPFLIPMHADPASVNSLQTTLGGTALFFSVFGNNSHFGKYQLYVEGQFKGNDHFVLKKAYAIVGDFTLGYTKSTFVDPASQPSTIEGAGPNSECDDTRNLLRFMHSVGKKFTYAVSVEQPDDQIPSVAGQYEAGSIFMPNVAAFVQLGRKSSHIRLAGLVKGMRYRNLVAGGNHYKMGWGLNLTTVFAPVPALTVYAAVNTGQGISSMVNDLSHGVTDLIGYADGSGRMYAPRSYGWYAALQYNYRPNLYSTLGVSQERIMPRSDSAYGAGDYKYGLYGVANLFWDVVPRCTVGAEFDLGRHATMDGEKRMGYRACLLAQFSF